MPASQTIDAENDVLSSRRGISSLVLFVDLRPLVAR